MKIALKSNGKLLVILTPVVEIPAEAVPGADHGKNTENDEGVSEITLANPLLDPHAASGNHDPLRCGGARGTVFGDEVWRHLPCLQGLRASGALSARADSSPESHNEEPVDE